MFVASITPMGLLVFVTVHKDSGYLLEVTGRGDQVRVLHHQQNMYRELRGEKEVICACVCARRSYVISGRASAFR